VLNSYATDKLRELDVELARRPSSRPSSTPTPVLGPLARAVGRTLRHAGERLESWSNPGIPSQAAPPFGGREESCEGC